MPKGRERSAKFYLKNEYEVMKDLGLKATKGSGNTWIDKEDGQNDHIICQLKSTDKESYKLTQLDLEKLEYNAMVSRKIPMFLLQFLNKDSRYAIVALEDIPKIAKYINTGEIEKPQESLIELQDIKPKKPNKPKISSSKNAREKFFKEKEKKWEERKWQK